MADQITHPPRLSDLQTDIARAQERPKMEVLERANERLTDTPADFWGLPAHERSRMLDRIAGLVMALERIAYLRPSKTQPSKIVEQMERIALDAIAKVKP